MKIIKTPIQDLLVLQPNIFNDSPRVGTTFVPLEEFGAYHHDFNEKYFLDWCDEFSSNNDYEYRKAGVSDSNKHTATLGACLRSGAECPDGYSPMIAGFTEKTKTMYEGQTLSVRIPAKDAYGVDPSMHDLGGEDLIFEIVIVSID